MKVVLKSALVVLGFSFLACGRGENESESKNVFGTDNRASMTSTSGIYRGIGMVRSGSAFCTGSLVWKNLVLTNAHCVFNDAGVVRTDLQFIAGKGTASEQTTSVAQVWYGTSTPNQDRKNDWAILRLIQNSSRPYFGYKSEQNLNPLTATLTLVGYSGDYLTATGHAGIQSGCKIRGQENGYYLHDCDTTGGSSGGPVFAETGGDAFIVAINAAQRFCEPATQGLCANGVAYSDARANIAVKTSSFTAKLTQLRAQFP